MKLPDVTGYVKKKLRISLLEGAVNTNQLPDDAVLIENGNSLTLYRTNYLRTNIAYDGVLAYIGLQHNRNYSEVTLVAARKGYGPLIYQLAMEFALPQPLVSARDGDTRESALNIWNYFLKKIGWVKTKTLTPDNYLYIDAFDWGDDETDPDFFKVINTQFFATDNNDFQTLKSDGDEFLETVGEDYRDIISQYGHDYFDAMY